MQRVNCFVNASPLPWAGPATILANVGFALTDLFIPFATGFAIVFMTKDANFAKGNVILT